MKTNAPNTLNPLRWLSATAALILTLALLSNCGDPSENLNPSGSMCGVLNTVQASAGGSIGGNASTGGLSDYSFQAGAEGMVDIQPPSATPCGNEIAQRLQGLCSVCEQNGAGACEDLAERLFNPAAGTFPEACAACGDGVCGPGESAVEAPGKLKCDLDCNGGTSCGDGMCASTENTENCPEDCENECGDGLCSNGEQIIDPDGANFCPVDCCVAETCGNSRCNSYCETVDNCPLDCSVCGDDICSDPDTGGRETLNSCPRDCSVCGDGMCSRNEVIANPDTSMGQRLCIIDCCASQAVCGDGTCSVGCETTETCAADCP